jgi:hypothetical protein
MEPQFGRRTVEPERTACACAVKAVCVGAGWAMCVPGLGCHSVHVHGELAMAPENHSGDAHGS